MVCTMVGRASAARLLLVVTRVVAELMVYLKLQQHSSLPSRFEVVNGGKVGSYAILPSG